MPFQKPQNGGQRQGDQRAVMEAAVAERVGERMARAQPLAEAHAAFERGHHELPARVAVIAVADRAFDMAEDARHPVERDGVGRRIERCREIALDAMGKRIHAGSGGEPRRQSERQFGIADRDLRHDVIAVQAAAAARRVGVNAGAARGFAAGAGGGGNGDQGRHRRGDLFGMAQEIPERTGVAGQRGDRLGAVDDRAAAHGDDAVAAFATIERDGAVDAGDGRVLRHIVEHHGPIARRQGLAHAGEGAAFHQALIGEEERARDFQVGELFRQRLDRAEIEMHARELDHRKQHERLARDFRRA